MSATAPTNIAVGGFTADQVDRISRAYMAMSPAKQKVLLAFLQRLAWAPAAKAEAMLRRDLARIRAGIPAAGEVISLPGGAS